jgi:maltose O-acetyltransferase
VSEISGGDWFAIQVKRAGTMLTQIQSKGELAQLRRKGLRYGRGLNVQRGADISDPHLVTIGDWVTLGPYSQLVAHDASHKRLIGYTRVGRITIGDKVFIGQRATILPGVTVGDGSIVAAGAVVISDVPARAIVAGNPARVVRELTDEYLTQKQAEAESLLIGKYDVPGGRIAWIV